MTSKIIIKNHTTLSESVIYYQIYRLIQDKKVHNNHNQDYLDNIVEFGTKKYLFRYRITERNNKIYDISYKF